MFLFINFSSSTLSTIEQLCTMYLPAFAILKRSSGFQILHKFLIFRNQKCCFLSWLIFPTILAMGIVLNSWARATCILMNTLFKSWLRTRTFVQYSLFARPPRLDKSSVQNILTKFLTIHNANPSILFSDTILRAHIRDYWLHVTCCFT